MKPVQFHPAARNELIESACYYQRQREGLGRRFASAVRDALRRIQERPQLYPAIEADVRRCRVLRFPYGVVYRVASGQIQVLAVMHLHRKPGYWKTRAVSAKAESKTN